MYDYKFSESVQRKDAALNFYKFYFGRKRRGFLLRKVFDKLRDYALLSTH